MRGPQPRRVASVRRSADSGAEVGKCATEQCQAVDLVQGIIKAGRRRPAQQAAKVFVALRIEQLYQVGASSAAAH